MSETVSLPERLDLSTAPDLAQTLLNYPADKTLLLDASQVSHFGALGLQVVLAAVFRANEAGGSIQLQNTPDRALEQLKAMGTSPEIITEATK